MPNPIRYRQGDVTYGYAALNARPALSVKIAIVMDCWAGFEMQLAIGFVTLLMGGDRGAYSIYNALVDRGIRETVFLALARERLSQELINRFEKFFGRVRKMASARNDIAHGQWAILSTRPTSLLLCPKDIRLSEYYKLVGAVADVTEGSAGVLRQLLKALDTFGSVVPTNTEFMEYTSSDFDDIAARINGLSTEFWSLMHEAVIGALVAKLERPDQQVAPHSPSIP